MSKQLLGLEQARTLLQIAQVEMGQYTYTTSQYAPILGAQGKPAFYWLPTGLIVTHPDNMPLLEAEAARVGGTLVEIRKEDFYGTIIQAFPPGASPPK